METLHSPSCRLVLVRQEHPEQPCLLTARMLPGCLQGEEGGALCLLDVATAKLSQLQLLHNTAEKAGGAAAVLRSAQVAISNSSFSSNTAAIGGALAADSSVLHLSIANFSNNTARASAVLQQPQAVRSSSSVTFASAVYGQGAGGAGLLQRSHLSLTDCGFNFNSATLDGGALLLRQPRTLRAEATTFTRNTAILGSGGAVALRGLGQPAAGSLLACSFVGNRAPEGRGGALFLDSELGVIKVSLRGCNFSASHAAADGGAIAGLGPSEVDAAGCHAYNNTAGSAGGWLSCQGCRQLFTANCTAAGNVASTAGGAVHCDSCAAVELAGDSYHINTAGAGGAVAVQGVGDVAIMRCQFSNNTAAAMGAAGVRGQGHNTSSGPTEAVVDQADIEGWQPEWQALCSVRSALQPTADTSCRMPGAGGAVCLHSAVVAVVADTSFVGNTGGTGGALLASASCLTTQVGGLRDNNGATAAAAAAAGSSSRGSQQCSLTLVNMTAAGNAADLAGGAVYTSTPDALRVLPDSTTAAPGVSSQAEVQQALLGQLADDNTATGGAYGPGAASAPTAFSLQPGAQQTLAAHSPGASRGRSLLQLTDMQAPQSMPSAGTRKLLFLVENKFL